MYVSCTAAIRVAAGSVACSFCLQDNATNAHYKSIQVSVCWVQVNSDAELSHARSKEEDPVHPGGTNAVAALWWTL
uniref:Uncharacterized protein n=1 Tax=Globisporangium ultimum (strain ATCC 200006 / CBS 805.95 / DAOM BR144) TaxID=431595 RepID=K3WF56_GLOUD